MGTADEIKFTYNVEANMLEAWHPNSPTTKFTMKPIFNKRGVITNLEVRFAHLPNFVAHYTWKYEAQRDTFQGRVSALESDLWNYLKFAFKEERVKPAFKTAKRHIRPRTRKNVSL